MILRVGYQSYEVRRAFELPRPLIFGSRDEALKWLKQLCFPHPEVILRFREYLAGFSYDVESFRLTDQEALERVAELLYSRKVVIVATEERTRSGAATSKAPSMEAAFPLSERASHRSPISSKPTPVEDPPTFDSRLDAVAQAAELVAAANEVRPFCPE